MIDNFFLWKPFIIWLQQRSKHWAKPDTLSLITATLSDLTRSRSDLVGDNALLRQQLIVLNRQVKRPQITKREWKPSVCKPSRSCSSSSWVPDASIWQVAQPTPIQSGSPSRHANGSGNWTIHLSLCVSSFTTGTRTLR